MHADSRTFICRKRPSPKRGCWKPLSGSSGLAAPSLDGRPVHGDVEATCCY